MSGGKRFTPEQLSDELLNNLENLQKEGGPQGLTKALGSDPERGLPNDQVESKRNEYGVNRPKERKRKTFFSFVLDAMKDKTLIILTVAAVVSIALGLTVEDPKTGWIDGTAILVAVIIVVSVTAGNDYNKEKKFRSLSEIRNERKVTVIRGGQKQEVSVFDVVVGDVVAVEAGDTIPADGVYLWGQDVSVDESPMTGESDSVRKNDDDKPFLLSGCTILEGTVHMVVIAVGSHSQWGKLSELLEGPSEDTPLTQKLEKLSENIGKAGLGASLLLLVILIVKWLIDLLKSGRGWQWSELGTLVSYVISCITLIVVAVPEGLPLAVTISLAFSMMRMMKDQNLVRHLEACETMGGATNICSDKTGTLTENRMTVTKWWIAGKASAEKGESTGTSDGRGQDGGLDKKVRDVFVEGVCVNSSAYLSEKDGKKEVVGNKTEGALLNLLASGSLSDKVDYQHVRDETKDRVEKLFPFNSTNKMMSTMIRLDGEAGHRLHTKGAAEIVIAACSQVMGQDGTTKTLDQQTRSQMEKMVEQFASEGLRTLALAFRDMQQVPRELEEAEDAASSSKDETKGGKKGGKDAPGRQRGVTGIKELTLVGLVGIKDPVRKGVPAAVKECQEAGIMVRMLTGDNLLTAQSIARECGILTEGGIALEGPKFRTLSEAEMDEVIPKLQVLARMTPSDKYLLVHRLRELGEVVAVTGDGVNDAPQLKEADVGFAMGSGTEVAKDASDIVLLDDNFSSLVKAVMWGRNVYNSIRKFIQFQLTVNVVAVIVSFAGAVTAGESPLTPVQLLWVNLIMDTFAALALATESPTLDLLKRRPYGRNDNLITRIMWRNIAGQAVFQLIVLAVMLYAMPVVPFLGLPAHKSDYTPHDKLAATTILFNTFVLCQLFNEINARNLTNDLNVFKRLFSNFIFLGVMAVTIIGQFLLVQFGGSFADTVPLSFQQWGVCLAIAFVTLPYGAFLRLVVRITDKESERAPVTAESMNKNAEKLKQGKGKQPEKEVPETDERFEKMPLLEEGRANELTHSPQTGAESWRRAQRKLSVVSAFRNAGRMANTNFPSKAGHLRRQSAVFYKQTRSNSMPPQSMATPGYSSLNY